MDRRKFFTRSANVELASGVGMPALLAKIPYIWADRKMKHVDINNIIKELEGLLPSLLKEFNVAGLSIALVNEGKLAWSRGFGACDINSRKPVNADTVFEIASISKTVFAYAVMKLVEQDVIDEEGHDQEPDRGRAQVDEAEEPLRQPRAHA